MKSAFVAAFFLVLGPVWIAEADNLVNASPQDSMPGWIQEFKSSSSQQALDALVLLAKDPAVQPALGSQAVSLLEDSSPNVRAGGRLVLQAMGSGAQNALFGALRSSNATVRQEAAFTTSEFQDASAFYPYLDAALSDPDVHVRGAAAYALDHTPEGRAELLRWKGEKKVQIQVEPPQVYATQSVASQTSGRPPTLADLQDPDWRVRAHAAHYYSDQVNPDSSALFPLRSLLTDPQSQVRSQAIQGVIRIKADPADLPQFRKMLSDPEPGVQMLAARAIGVFGPEATSAIPDLVQYGVQDSGEARDALNKIGTADALKAASLLSAPSHARPTHDQIAPNASVEDPYHSIMAGYHRFWFVLIAMAAAVLWLTLRLINWAVRKLR